MSSSSPRLEPTRYAKKVRVATLCVQATSGQSGATKLEDDTSVDATVDLNALLADHTEVCVDLRSLARSRVDGFQEEIKLGITAVHRQSSPASLRIHTGAPSASLIQQLG